MGNANVDGTAIEVRLVQPVDSGLCRGFVIELNEAKPPGAPGLAINDHCCAENLTELGKRLLQLMVHGGIGQIAHEQLRAHAYQTRVIFFVSQLFTTDAWLEYQHLADRGGRLPDSSQAVLTLGTRSVSGRGKT